MVIVLKVPRAWRQCPSAMLPALRVQRAQTLGMKTTWSTVKRTSFLLLVRPGAPLVASLLLVAKPFAPSSFFVPKPIGLKSTKRRQNMSPPRCYLLLVEMPGASSSFLLLVAMPLFRKSMSTIALHSVRMVTSRMCHTCTLDPLSPGGCGCSMNALLAERHDQDTRLKESRAWPVSR